VEEGSDSRSNTPSHLLHRKHWAAPISQAVVAGVRTAEPSYRRKPRQHDLADMSRVSLKGSGRYSGFISSRQPRFVLRRDGPCSVRMHSLAWDSDGLLRVDGETGKVNNVM